MVFALTVSLRTTQAKLNIMGGPRQGQGRNMSSLWRFVWFTIPNVERFNTNHTDENKQSFNSHEIPTMLIWLLESAVTSVIAGSGFND